MRILFGFLIVVLLAIPTHAYLPGNCNHGSSITDFRDADTVVIGQVAGFERVMETVPILGSEKTTTVFTYFAKVQIARAVTGKFKEGDEILVFEGNGEQWKGERFAQSHWIKQCNSHASAGMKLGNAYIFALDVKHGKAGTDGKALKDRTWYELRSCHASLHAIENCVDEENDRYWDGVKFTDDGAKDPPYITVDAFLAHMKKRSESAPAK